MACVDYDYVPTLVANAVHPAIDDYLQRSRGEWPPHDQLDEIKQLPLCLVLVGSKESANPDQQARVSWSCGEILLISQLPSIVKQGYIATKFTFKYVIKTIRDGNSGADGRSHVGSYHLKTTFLHHLEKTPPSKINSPFCLMMNLLHDLRMYLINGYLPHYFLQECDLLTTIGPDERQIALKAIQAIVSNPMAAIIKCPSEPREIYGDDFCPEDLVSALSNVFDDPSRDKCREAFGILSQLDQWRAQYYHKQLKEDVEDWVSGRPNLTGLAGTLEKNLTFVNIFHH